MGGRRIRNRPSKLLLRNLPFPAVIALRYLRSTRRDAFASFLSAVAAVGLALGVAAMILSLAVISGFQSALRGELLGRTPQIEAELPPGADAEAARAAAARVPGVISVQIQVRGGGWLVDRGKVQAVELVGFDGRVPRTFPGAEGRPEGLYVPGTLAARWGLAPGAVLDVVSPRPTLTPLGPQPRLRSLPVAGTYASPRTQEEREPVALPRAVAESLLGTADRRLDVEAGDLDAALDVAGRLPSALPPGTKVRTWKDLNRPLLFALRLEKLMMFVAVSLIVLVASLALVADLALIISSKRPEIGMLGTLGATPAALRQAFVLLGGLVAGSGVLVGTALGVGSAWVMDHYRLLRVPGRVYFLDYVPFLVQPGDLVVVLLLTFALALASSLYAAQRAAALDPIEALKR
jgi:lipoprotein-releasing system permease protein